MRIFILLLSVVLVSACGTSSVSNLSLLTQPIPSDGARLVVNRNNSLLYMAAGANVMVNGSKIANLGRGGGIVKDIQSGRNTLSAGTLGSFGKYSYTFDAETGKTYVFEVSPRSEAMNTAMFGALGDAVSAHVNENSGYFKVQLVEIQ